MSNLTGTESGVHNLVEAIAERPHTAEPRARAVALVLKGIVEWLTDEPTIAASIVEDVARMIERCQDGEELRDLSVQIRDLMYRYEPDAGRVALTPQEAQLLHVFER